MLRFNFIKEKEESTLDDQSYDLVSITGGNKKCSEISDFPSCLTGATINFYDKNSRELLDAIQYDDVADDYSLEITSEKIIVFEKGSDTLLGTVSGFSELNSEL